MIFELEPKDVVVLHPNALKGITIRNDLDRKLIDALEWGYSLHPELRVNVGTFGESHHETTIVWPESTKVDSDIVEAISVFTVPPNLPIAGLAEHLISFRRLLTSTHMDITRGDSWGAGANLHLHNLML